MMCVSVFIWLLILNICAQQRFLNLLVSLDTIGGGGAHMETYQEAGGRSTCSQKPLEMARPPWIISPNHLSSTLICLSIYCLKM